LQQASARSLAPRASALRIDLLSLAHMQWTHTLDGFARRCNTLPALVAHTVGRGKSETTARSLATCRVHLSFTLTFYACQTLAVHYSGPGAGGTVQSLHQSN
jgi:hypothetical protein